MCMAPPTVLDGAALNKQKKLSLKYNIKCTISELRDVTCHMGSHSVTCHPTQVNAPRLTPARQVGTWFTYPWGMEGWVDLVDLIAPRSAVEPVTFRSRIRRRTAAAPRQQKGSTNYESACIQWYVDHLYCLTCCLAMTESRWSTVVSCRQAYDAIHSNWRHKHALNTVPTHSQANSFHISNWRHNTHYGKILEIFWKNTTEIFGNFPEKCEIFLTIFPPHRRTIFPPQITVRRKNCVENFIFFRKISENFRRIFPENFQYFSIMRVCGVSYWYENY